jgi:putative ABC transport system permease protein
MACCSNRCPTRTPSASCSFGKSLASLLFHTSLTDIPTMLAVGCVLALVALLACYIPARRVARMDPILALREG